MNDHRLVGSLRGNPPKVFREFPDGFDTFKLSEAGQPAPGIPRSRSFEVGHVKEWECPERDLFGGLLG